jgi:hypothetical protein
MIFYFFWVAGKEVVALFFATLAGINMFLPRQKALFLFSHPKEIKNHCT